MKRYGILTFHNAHNFGAMLQAYALTTYINSIDDCSAEIINYKLPAVEIHSHKDSLRELMAKEGPIGIVRWCNRRFVTGYYNDLAWNRFQNFSRKNICMSKEISRENLCQTSYDGYIVGSDQVWNEELTDGMQKCYFLDFVNENALKIAYAASSGKSNLDTSDDEIIKLLKDFDYIGVREDGLRHDLKNRFDIMSDTVIDPVFLLDSTHWKSFVKKPEHAKYLLIYVFDESSSVYEYAKKVAQARNLQIIALACHGIKDIDKNILQTNTCGPEEFLSYVYYADFIITSSFHCTAFSIIFEKQFVCVPHPKYHERTDYILQITGLEKRRGETSQMEDIDYTVVTNSLRKIVDRSKFFLKRAMSNNGNLFPFSPYKSKENCCGCTACAMKCPQGAIVMKEDNEGFLYPMIEKDKCVFCNMCLSVCPFSNAQMHRYKKVDC